MYQDGNYNVLEFFPPAQGMNSNIAPSLLPKDFAAYLENMMVHPLGEVSMRFGTSLVANIGLSLWPDNKILESFPFIAPDGSKQVIIYATYFVNDDTVQDITVISSNSFSFTTNSPNQYVVDAEIKLVTNFQGVPGNLTGYSYITGVITADNLVTVTIREDLALDVAKTEITQIYYPVGRIYSFDLKTSTLISRMDNLSASCLPRATTFLNNLIICNGINKNMRWDGANITILYEFVKEAAANNLTRVNNNSFNFKLNPDLAADVVAFDITKYQNNATIQLNINGAVTETTVVNIAISGAANDIVTITTTGLIPQFGNRNSLFYQDFPPPFSFIKVAYNRIWGLGSGAVGVNYRDPNQALRVYFSYLTNTLFGWFNDNTKSVPSINLSQNHGTIDNLEAIIQTDSFLAFVGRKRTQVWTGSIPLGAAPIPNFPAFTFSSLLPVGIVHGNLFVELSNDAIFVSQNGVMSFGSLNIAKQFAASSINAVDPLVREYTKDIDRDNVAYRACRSFKYASGSFLGFKIGNNKVLTSLYSTTCYSWSLFSGDFANASSFINDLDSSLYLMINNNLFVYADHTLEAPVYGDNNGQSLIFGVWELPEMSFSGKRYANKRCELIASYSSSFPNDARNSIAIEIDGDLRKTFTLSGEYPLQYKGDSLSSIPLYNNPEVDPTDKSLGLHFEEPYGYIKSRLKFLSSRFTTRVLCTSITSQLKINKLRLFGILERNS